MIDLHTHSSASDGSFSPEELVFYAAEKGLSALALTDHDTVGGLEEAEKAAKKARIHFIPGIELNIEWQQGEFHLLGFGMYKFGRSLNSLIDFLQKKRKKRNKEIFKKLEKFNLCTSFEEMETCFRSKNFGRPHIADYLVLKKVVKTRQQAFDLYLARGRPCYVDRTGADLKEAVEAIKESGGVCVLAHPMSLYLSWGKLPAILTNIFEAGVAGIEAWHPGARVAECKRLEKLGRETGFFITAGSDFHGEKIRLDRKIGKTAGLTSIDDSFWTKELLPAIQKQNGSK